MISRYPTPQNERPMQLVVLRTRRMSSPSARGDGGGGVMSCSARRKLGVRTKHHLNPLTPRSGAGGGRGCETCTVSASRRCPYSGGSPGVAIVRIRHLSQVVLISAEARKDMKRAPRSLRRAFSHLISKRGKPGTKGRMRTPFRHPGNGGNHG